MPRRRHPAIIPILGMLVIACSSVSPARTPGAAGSVAPSPIASPSASPAATSVPTPAVPATCPPGPASGDIRLTTATGIETIELGEGPIPSPVAIDATDMTIVATVLGGTALRAELLLLGGPREGTAISELTADFLPFGTASVAPVQVTVDGSGASLVLPDRDVNGQLRIAVAWTSACGDGDGAGSIALSVVNSKVAAGCPTTADGILGAVQGLDSARITVGTLDVPLIVTSWSGRWIVASGAADLPEFGGWDQDRSTVAAPGDSVVVRESIDDLYLQSLSARTFLRADVLAYLEPDATTPPEEIDSVRRNAGPRGRAGIPAPLETGRYVLEIQARWVTSCLALETYTVVSVEVR